MYRLASLLFFVAGGAVVDAAWLRWTAGDGNAPWLPPVQTGDGKDARCRAGLSPPHFPAAATTISPPEAALELRQARTTTYVNSKTCGWYGSESSSAMRCTLSETCATELGVVACTADDNTNTGFFTACYDLKASKQGLCKDAGALTGCCHDSTYAYCATAFWASQKSVSRYYCETTPVIVTMYDRPAYLATATSSSSSSSSSSSTTPGPTPPTPTPSPDNSGSGGGATPVGAIVGGVVGGLAVLGLIIGLGVWLFMRKNRTADAAAASQQPPPPPGGGYAMSPPPQTEAKFLGTPLSSPTMSPGSPPPPFHETGPRASSVYFGAPPLSSSVSPLASPVVSPPGSPPPPGPWQPQQPLGSVQPQQPVQDSRYSVMSAELPTVAPRGHQQNPIEMG